MKTNKVLGAITQWMAIGIVASSSLRAAAPKPNIVLFYIDDWAWSGTPVAMDESMKNSHMPILHMPNVEKLSREGMKFRNAYSSPKGRQPVLSANLTLRHARRLRMSRQDPQKYAQHPLIQAWYKENNKDPETVSRGDDPALWFGMGEDLDGRIGAVLEKSKPLKLRRTRTSSSWPTTATDMRNSNSPPVSPSLSTPGNGGCGTAASACP